MEALEDSNCHSMSDSFSLYERYVRTFNVVNTFLEDISDNQPTENDRASRTSNLGLLNPIEDIDLSIHSEIQEHTDPLETAFGSVNPDNKCAISREDTSVNSEFQTKIHFPELLNGGSLLNSSITEESYLTDKFDPIDVPVSSEDSKSDRSKHPKPVIITSLITMENSNNAVDSVPLFRGVRPSDSVFKLPISELTFNGTLKHMQKLKPIVDPLCTLTSTLACDLEKEPYGETKFPSSYNSNFDNSGFLDQKSESNYKCSDASEDQSEVSRIDALESTGDSQYEEYPKKEVEVENESKSKWNLEQNTSSLEASFDSGVRSPDIFSEDDEDLVADPEQDLEPDFWHFLKDYETHDKRKVNKMEQSLQGVLPPPSVTIIKTDITEMLRKYYCFLPAFTENSNITPDVHSTTPTKMTSFIKIPIDVVPPENILQETTESFTQKQPRPEIETNSKTMHEHEDKLEIIQEAIISESSSVSVPKHKPDEKPKINIETPVSRSSLSKESKSDCELNTSVADKSIVLPMCSEAEAAGTVWPDLLKCRYYGVHYNVTRYSERMELLAQRYGERCVGADTDTSVTVFSGGLVSPTSASKRKALRLKMAQAKSPGRRLSHLARRRQAFCSAATIGDKAHSSNSKVVLIDKNFFPHRKLINSAERRSPRLRRSPGAARNTPGKRTPSKTPKSGGSTRKKAMRRLLLDPDSLTRSQPTRESSKRALFVSPDNRKAVPLAPSASVPLHAMKSKRNLFGSPDGQADSKSLDGSRSAMFLKRKRDYNDVDEGRCKVAKSLSFGGDTIGSTRAGPSVSRRASEMFATRNMAELDEHHRKKLLWAVSEALRVHGWRMQSPGFREKASALAQLVRRLLTLPAHADKLSATKLSTSETFLKIARQYVFAIIQGRTVDECFLEEQTKLANETNQKVTGYISASAYQQRTKPAATLSSQIKENTCDGIKQELQRSGSKNVLQDKLLNVDTGSNSSGLSMLDKAGLFKSNSMPSFEDAAKMRARRQISFDNVDFPKR